MGSVTRQSGFAAACNGFRCVPLGGLSRMTFQCKLSPTSQLTSWGERMDDNPDQVWLTYDEAAKALQIKADSVRRRAAARKWPKRAGNDKLVRVGIPRDVIPDTTPAITHDIMGDNPDASQTEIRFLREQIEDLKQDKKALTALLEKALEARPAEAHRGLIRKLFGL
ncbi:hypothetical protein GALL_479420 [mine drainage metagenome]|uniref:Uncharacterized protein n=1 Tax=mine drainage metagenome TaxID=410659 RepID=A0A1J5Q3J8_9ZZZZ